MILSDKSLISAIKEIAYSKLEIKHNTPIKSKRMVEANEIVSYIISQSHFIEKYNKTEVCRVMRCERSTNDRRIARLLKKSEKDSTLMFRVDLIMEDIENELKFRFRNRRDSNGDGQEESGVCSVESDSNSEVLQSCANPDPYLEFMETIGGITGS